MLPENAKILEATLKSNGIILFLPISLDFIKCKDNVLTHNGIPMAVIAPLRILGFGTRFIRIERFKSPIITDFLHTLSLKSNQKEIVKLESGSKSRGKYKNLKFLLKRH